MCGKESGAKRLSGRVGERESGRATALLMLCVRGRGEKQHSTKNGKRAGDQRERTRELN